MDCVDKNQNYIEKWLKEFQISNVCSINIHNINIITKMNLSINVVIFLFPPILDLARNHVKNSNKMAAYIIEMLTQIFT